MGRVHTTLHVYQRTVADYIKKRRTVKLLHMLRGYSAFVVVVSSALLVIATNVASGKNVNGFMFGYWAGEDTDAITSRNSGQVIKKNDLALVPLAKASTAVDPTIKEEDIIFIEASQNTLAASITTSANIQKDPEEDGGVKMYTVKQGDTVSTIAAKHGITTNTILWANDIDNVDSIMPGDTLFILPVSGISYAVKKGDSLNTIADKYKADKEKIIAFNDLPANGNIEEGDVIIIPDGRKEVPAAPQVANSTNPNGSVVERRQYATTTGGAPEVSGWRTPQGKPGAGHKFPYGWCTWYVAQKRYVPWGGNAGTWLYNAKAMGYKTGRAPKVGAIMVTTENRYYGHVAYVEKVNGDTITVSEMNYVGWGKASRRTISASSRAIKGFIY